MNIFYLDNIHTINVQARLFFESLHSGWLTELMILITDLGSPGSIFLYCLVLVMLMWLHHKYTHLIQFIVTISLTAFIAVLLKEITQIPRPSYSLIPEIGYSFASAHAMIATVFFSLIIHAYRNHFKGKFIKNSFVVLNVCAIMFVCLSRVYLGVHYMTDVLAGFFIGLIISSMSVIMYNRMHVKRTDSIKPVK